MKTKYKGNSRIFFGISFFMILAAGIITALISLGSEKSIFLGFSIKRIFLLVAILSMDFLVLAAGFQWSKKYKNVVDLYGCFSGFIKRVFKIVSILFTIWGLISLYFPPGVFGSLSGYYRLMRPFSISIGLILGQFWFFIWLENRNRSIKQDFHTLVLPYRKSLSIISLILFGLAIFIYVTKIGLAKDTPYWNVAGIPLSGLQFLFIFIFLALYIFVLPMLLKKLKPGRNSYLHAIIIVVLYLAAVLLWSTTPMIRHFFALETTPPNYQPYPFSDARVHDLGAISILNGEGIYFHGYTDKPFYMLILAFLHLFSGSDYVTLARVQILLLAFIPVILYLLGTRFYGKSLGIALAATVILQQRNAIFLADKIASVNPRLLVTEEVTLLGIVFCVYLLLVWLKTGESKYALLLGGLTGILSLIRLNPLVLFPMIVLFCIGFNKKKLKPMIQQTLLITLGFLIIFAPWLITGVDSTNTPWIAVKINDILHNRIDPNLNNTGINIEPVQTEEPTLVDLEKKPAWDGKSVLARSVPEIPAGDASKALLNSNDPANPSGGGKILQYGLLFINHYLHNFATSFLALPDSSAFVSLEALSNRDYWSDLIKWSGVLPVNQWGILLCNLFLLSIGLSTSWKHHRWIGLMPMIVFLTYDFAISGALNSGSRYIVPIDWILYFYYLMGILTVVKLMRNLILPKYISDSIVESHNFQLNTPKKKSGIPSILVVLVLIGSLIPIVNLVIPNLIQQSTRQDQETALAALQIKAGEQVEYGQILYPYYEKDGKHITLDFLSNEVTSTFGIDREGILDGRVILESQLPAYFIFSSPNQQKTLTGIYLSKNGLPVLFWQSSD